MLEEVFGKQGLQEMGYTGAVPSSSSGKFAMSESKRTAEVLEGMRAGEKPGRSDSESKTSTSKDASGQGKEKFRHPLFRQHIEE